MTNRRGGSEGFQGGITAHPSVIIPAAYDTVGSLQLWVRGDLGVTIGTGVSTWADQSGNSRNLTQATGSKQPAFLASAIGGKPGVVWDGTDDFLATAAIDSTAWVGISIFMVFLDTSTTLKAVVDKALNATAAGIYMNVNDTVAGRCDLYLKGSTSAIKAHRASGVPFSSATIWCVAFDPTLADGSEIKAYINGSAQSLSALITGETTGNLGSEVLTLGALTNGTACWPGVICEFAMFSKALSASDITTLTSYAQVRYGL